MALAAFDTHTFVKRLTKAGMPVEQAEVLSEEQARLVNDRLATKDDLALLGKDLRREIGDLRKDMDAKLEKLFLRLVIWLGSIVFLVVNTGPILPKLLHLT